MPGQNAIGEVTPDSEEAILAAESAYDALSEDEKAAVENHDALAAARETFDSLSVLETAHVTIDGIYVDDSYSNPDYPGTKLVYLFFTAKAPDGNYKVSSRLIDMTFEGVNTYESEMYPYDTGAGAKFASSYHYDSSLTDVFIGNGTKVAATFRIPEGELEPGRAVSIDDGNYANFDGTKLYTDDFIHMDGAEAIAEAVDPEGYAAEIKRREPADSGTAQTVQSLLNGYMWTFWTTYPVSTTYEIEFWDPNNFEVRTSLLPGGNGGTYEITNSYIMCTYSSNGTTIEIPYQLSNGDIELDLGAVW